MKTSLVSVLVLTAALHVGCSDIKLGSAGVKEQTSTPPPPPPTWKVPTVTQAQCDAIFKAPGGWVINDLNEGLYFICSTFDKVNENFILAPEMRFFQDVGLRAGNYNTSMFHQTENGISIGYGGVDVINETLTNIENKLAKMEGKITYRQTKGSSNILTPLRSGVIYKLDTLTGEEIFEYQLQGENKYGVGPVKTILFEVKKAGINPVASPQCPGFSNTVYMDLDQYMGGRLLTKHYGQFGQNAALVVKFTLKNTGRINLRGLGNGWTYSDKSGNFSTRPCDFTTNVGTFYANESFNDMPTFSFADYSTDIVNTNRTFYINVKNLNTNWGCAAIGYSDCALHFDFGRTKMQLAEFGNTVYYRKDWGYPDCYGGGGKSTRTYNWNAVTGGYDEGTCEQGQYIDPYYVL